MDYITMSDVDMDGKRVLVREDFNVPMEEGRVGSDARIRAAVPTIRHALEKGAGVALLSHLGRPREGRCEETFSLRPVARRLSELLDMPVAFHPHWLDGFPLAPGEVALCENVRFNVGEKADSEALGRRMAALCDHFVMDAFGTAHRAHASTHAVARFAPMACAGPLLHAELATLGRALASPARPVTAIVGGSKVSTKLPVLHALLDKVDTLILGGGIANTFLAAMGHDVAASLHEPEFVAEAAAILTAARERGVRVPLPVDVVCATTLAPWACGVHRKPDGLRPGEMILDIGPETAALYASIVHWSATVVWNGPVGVFEFEHFGEGTRVLAEAVAASAGFSIAGGGDTLAAVERFGVGQGISYISTGGGAFLELLQGRPLPAVAMLAQRAAALATVA
ncbi:MAG: phosphoglycerate kinase [Desulfovibrionaceae bacterium]